jgi:asparagine synthase (glutamine-hydrolysing)
MCGLTGFWQHQGFVAEEAHATASRTADALVHRGPDDVGVWVDAAAGLALGHRRLAILDLSPAGHQPMVSASGRFVIAFNGEVYNHLALRQQLAAQGAAPAWRGHSDTETLLAAIEAWGVEATLKQAVGMFALALWDREARTLVLARDRMGEKPLYWGWQNGVLLFGSELKALRQHPAFGGQIDRDALALFMRHGYLPAPFSIYQGIHKLPPGTWVSISQRDAATHTAPAPRAYWSVHQAVLHGQAQPYTGSDADAVQALDGLLRQAIQGQMLADVPLGAFLSGGVDSSTVVAVMQSLSSRPVKTFSIGFHEKDYNEAEHARAVAAYLGCEHTELYVTPAQAMAVIPRLPTLYDEPFADSSQIPTFLVAQLAREHVTVSLSGDGGDELFGGYTRYLWTRRIWNALRWLPLPARRALAAALVWPSPQAWNRLLRTLQPVLPRGLRVRLAGDKMHKLAELVALASPEAVYRYLVSHWKHPADDLVIGAREPQTILQRPHEWPPLATLEERMMYLDQMTYLPDDILVKVDRAAMGVSLETRVPLLDHRIVEFAWALPLAMKLRDGQTKWLLRQVLYRYVPRHLIERPKMGFGIPLDTWLRGPLREWAEDLLSEERLKREGFLHPAPIRHKWAEHLSGQRNWAFYLWNVLMFQAWLHATYTSQSSSPATGVKR